MTLWSRDIGTVSEGAVALNDINPELAGRLLDLAVRMGEDYDEHVRQQVFQAHRDQEETGNVD